MKAKGPTSTNHMANVANLRSVCAKCSNVLATKSTHKAPRVTNAGAINTNARNLSKIDRMLPLYLCARKDGNNE